MKLACDVMLGRLARWLRVSGHDVFYEGGIERSSLFRVAREEGRVIITRAGNWGELKAIPEYVVVSSDSLDEQLLELYRKLPGLDPLEGFLTRCVECNVPLEVIDRDAFREIIPPKAFDLAGRFSRCPSCGKILWEGTHVRRMKKRISDLARALGRELP
ncbi:MAG: Mut7-C RNAse domain-containing protein [Proteobacteria bacterium]|nr:Mut7-C RNAse domain-containing protein [Pseudomonadota bacterium]